MKVPATQTHTSNVNYHHSKPFLNKNSAGTFFSKSQAHNQPFFNSWTIQPKLTINQQNDPYEQKADAMAEKLVGQMASSNPAFTVHPGKKSTGSPTVISKREVMPRQKGLAIQAKKIPQNTMEACIKEKGDEVNSDCYCEDKFHYSPKLMQPWCVVRAVKNCVDADGDKAVGDCLTKIDAVRTCMSAPYCEDESQIETE